MAKKSKNQINKVLNEGYVAFNFEDYIDNPVAISRISQNLTQKELADKLGVTEAYVSKIEGQEVVSAKVLAKVRRALQKE